MKRTTKPALRLRVFLAMELGPWSLMSLGISTCCRVRRTGLPWANDWTQKERHWIPCLKVPGTFKVVRISSSSGGAIADGRSNVAIALRSPFASSIISQNSSKFCATAKKAASRLAGSSNASEYWWGPKAMTMLSVSSLCQSCGLGFHMTWVHPPSSCEPDCRLVLCLFFKAVSWPCHGWPQERGWAERLVFAFLGWFPWLCRFCVSEFTSDWSPFHKSKSAWFCALVTRDFKAWSKGPSCVGALGFGCLCAVRSAWSPAKRSASCFDFVFPAPPQRRGQFFANLSVCKASAVGKSLRKRWISCRFCFGEKLLLLLCPGCSSSDASACWCSWKWGRACDWSFFPLCGLDSLSHTSIKKLSSGKTVLPNGLLQTLEIESSSSQTISFCKSFSERSFPSNALVKNLGTLSWWSPWTSWYGCDCVLSGLSWLESCPNMSVKTFSCKSLWWKSAWSNEMVQRLCAPTSFSNFCLIGLCFRFRAGLRGQE